MRQFEGLRQRQQGGESGGPEGGPAASAAPEADGGAALVLPARKRRVIDVLQEQLADSGEGTDGDEEADDLVLDWRAKGV